MEKSKVLFNAEEHTYTTADGRNLGGVTPIVAWMYPNTYASITREVLAKAANYGTMVHRACEAADNGIVAADDFVQSYVNIKKEAGLTTSANELIIDNDKVASAIDVVATDEDGKTWLLDIKTTSSLHYENVRLQLSIYAAMYEGMGGEVDRLAAIWLPKEQYGTPKLVPVNRIPADTCNAIIDAFLANDEDKREELLAAVADNVPAEVRDAEGALIQIITKQKQMEAQRKEIEDRLLELMQAHDVKKYESDRIAITRVLSSTRTSIDSKKLKAEYPEIAAACEKTTTTKESIKITIK